MLDWFLHSVAAWIGLGGVAVLICGVIAWFIPGLRLLMLEIAGGIVAAATIYAKGASDARKQKQAEWDAAERSSIARGNKANADAKRDVAAGSVRDKFDRDDL